MEANELYERLTQSPLTIDGTNLTLELDRDEIQNHYAPLARTILKIRPREGRVLVAVAGPPGSGKTAFTAILTAAINTLVGEEIAVLVGLDGWHFSNAYLDRHFVEFQGESIPLRRLKGTPQTYNAQSIARFLAQVHPEKAVCFPVYSRELHDPIPAAGKIGPEARIVILEGNYWLLDQPPWSDFQPSFDLRIFLTAKPETLIAGLRQRHQRGGKDAEAVERNLRDVDLPDMDLVLNHSVPADVTVHKTDSRRIAAVDWNQRTQ